MSNANLKNADLESANLQGTNLTKAESLKNVNFTNAIMPDGTKYEEWVKRQ